MIEIMSIKTDNWHDYEFDDSIEKGEFPEISHNGKCLNRISIRPIKVSTPTQYHADYQVDDKIITLSFWDDAYAAVTGKHSFSIRRFVLQPRSLAPPIKLPASPQPFSASSEPSGFGYY